MLAFDGLKPWRCQVAIDVGTAFFRIAAERFGVVTIPTSVAPKSLLQGGVVIDPDGVTEVLRPIVTQAKALGLFRPLVLAGTPTDAQAGERKALSMALQKAGAAKVQIVPEPLAAAIGAGLDISLPYAQMVLDVGEGVTDCVILRDGRILKSHASRVGCGALRQRVWSGFRSTWDSGISLPEAERMVATEGVGGGGPDRPAVLSAERKRSVHSLLEPMVQEILSVPATLLQEVPADIGCEVIESGILLTGGGALIPGLPERLAAATSIRVTAPAKPLDVVVKGLQGMLSPSR